MVNIIECTGIMRTNPGQSRPAPPLLLRGEISCQWQVGKALFLGIAKEIGHTGALVRCGGRWRRRGKNSECHIVVCDSSGGSKGRRRGGGTSLDMMTIFGVFFLFRVVRRSFAVKNKEESKIVNFS
jgi:hypothetical protein